MQNLVVIVSLNPSPSQMTSLSKQRLHRRLTGNERKLARDVNWIQIFCALRLTKKNRVFGDFSFLRTCCVVKKEKIEFQLRQWYQKEESRSREEKNIANIFSYSIAWVENRPSHSTTAERTQKTAAKVEFENNWAHKSSLACRRHWEESSRFSLSNVQRSV